VSGLAAQTLHNLAMVEARGLLKGGDEVGEP